MHVEDKTMALNVAKTVGLLVVIGICLAFFSAAIA